MYDVVIVATNDEQRPARNSGGVSGNADRATFGRLSDLTQRADAAGSVAGTAMETRAKRP
jgi:hypothetical protein